MKGFILAIIIALSCTMVYAETTDPQSTVDVHNMYRNQLNSGILGSQPAPNPMIPDLIWDQTLAESADEHTQKCVWQHSGTGGENLYATSRSSDGIVQGVGAWVNEHNDYVYKPLGQTQSGVTGHYTQVVWANTTKVGCAKQYCSPILNSDGTRLFSGTMYTCQYRASGNYWGQYPYQINGSDDAVTDYEGFNENLYMMVNGNSTSYRVKFDMIERNPIRFRVISFDVVDYLDSFNRALYNGNDLIVNTLTLNGLGDYRATFRRYENLDFELINFKEN